MLFDELLKLGEFDDVILASMAEQFGNWIRSHAKLIPCQEQDRLIDEVPLSPEGSLYHCNDNVDYGTKYSYSSLF